MMRTFREQLSVLQKQRTKVHFASIDLTILLVKGHCTDASSCEEGFLSGPLVGGSQCSEVLSEDTHDVSLTVVVEVSCPHKPPVLGLSPSVWKLVREDVL